MTRVAPSSRGVIDPADGAHLDCCWSDCERRGYMLYRVRIYEGYHPGTRAPVYTWKIFCSERHKQYYVHAPRSLNKLPPGYRLALT